MHTQNINVKTAAQEPSERWGEKDFQDLKQRAHGLIENHSCLKEGITVSIADVSRHGDFQVEILKFGQPDWRAWSFEPDFLTDLERNLIRVQSI